MAAEKQPKRRGKCAVQMLAEECKCVKLFDHPTDSEEPNSIIVKEFSHVLMQYAPVNIPIMGERRPTPNSMRRHKNNMGRIIISQSDNFPDPSGQIKLKIATLVEQAILDTNRTITSIRSFKNKISSMAEYKIGYIISYIRQERQILNDFFDLAVAYRDHSEALQQMKVFEYIMQGNRNIKSLVRQLIQIHIQKRDATTTTTHEPTVGTTDDSYTDVVLEEGPPYYIKGPVIKPAPSYSDDTTTTTTDSKVPGRTGIRPYFYKHIGAVQMLAEECKCVKLFDHPTDSEEPNSIIVKELSHVLMQYAPVNLPIMGERRPTPNSLRRHKNNMGRIIRKQFENFPDPSEQIKLKIATLVEQAILDTNRTVISIRSFKNKISLMAEYKIGYIISYIRQERQILNDFFDLAVAYRDHSEALQQMKVFEYIMQGNRNITSLVRQLIQIHIQKRDATTTTTHEPTAEIPDYIHIETVLVPVPTVSYEITPSVSDPKVQGRIGIPPYFYNHKG